MWGWGRGWRRVTQGGLEGCCWGADVRRSCARSRLAPDRSTRSPLPPRPRTASRPQPHARLCVGQQRDLVAVGGGQHYVPAQEGVCGGWGGGGGAGLGGRVGGQGWGAGLRRGWGAGLRRGWGAGALGCEAPRARTHASAGLPPPLCSPADLAQHVHAALGVVLHSRRVVDGPAQWAGGEAGRGGEWWVAGRGAGRRIGRGAALGPPRPPPQRLLHSSCCNPPVPPGSPVAAADLEVVVRVLVVADHKGVVPQLELLKGRGALHGWAGGRVGEWWVGGGWMRGGVRVRGQVAGALAARPSSLRAAGHAPPPPPHTHPTHARPPPRAAQWRCPRFQSLPCSPPSWRPRAR